MPTKPNLPDWPPQRSVDLTTMALAGVAMAVLVLGGDGAMLAGLGLLALSLQLIGQHLRARFLAKKLVEGRRRMEALCRIGRGTAGFVHDMKNASMVVRGFSQMARRTVEADEPDLKRLRELLDDLDRLSESTAQGARAIIDLARGDVADDPARPLGDVLEETGRLLAAVAASRDLTFERHLPRESIERPVRGRRIMGALLDVGLNALEHTTSKTRIEAAVVGNRIEVTVDDDGPGLANAPDDPFEPFATGGGGGTGVGLWSAREALRAEGGDITLEAGPEGGTRVRMHLPHA